MQAGWVLPRDDRERAARLGRLVAEVAPTDAVLLLGDGDALAFGAGVVDDDLPLVRDVGHPLVVGRIAARRSAEAHAAIENRVSWGSVARIVTVGSFGVERVDGGFIPETQGGQAGGGTLVLYQGHGSPEGPVPAVDLNCAAGPGPFIAVLLGCQMGLEREEAPSFATRLVCTAGGAAAVIAANHVTTVEVDHALSRAFQGILRATAGRPVDVGALLARASDHVRTHPPTDVPVSEVERTLTCYRVFGDPTSLIGSYGAN